MYYLMHFLIKNTDLKCVTKNINSTLFVMPIFPPIIRPFPPNNVLAAGP